MSRAPFRILGIKTAFLGEKRASKSKTSPVQTSSSDLTQGSRRGSVHAEGKQRTTLAAPPVPSKPPQSAPSKTTSSPSFYNANHVSASSLAPTVHSTYSESVPSTVLQNCDEPGNKISGEKTQISTKTYIKMIQAKIDDLENEHDLMRTQLKREKILHEETWGKLQSKERDLVDLIGEKNQDIKKWQGDLHRHTKDIKVEDDDYSTINRKMINLLDYNLANLPLALKKYSRCHVEITKYFLEKWPELEPVVSRFAKPTQGSTNLQLNYSFICLLVEKLVAEILVEDVFFVPIYLGHPELNDAFQNIEAWMKEKNAPENWAIRLRQQLCKAATDKGLQSTADAKKAIVKKLIEVLSNIFTLENNAQVFEKLSYIVDSATSISMAMRQEKDPVKYRHFAQGDKLDADTMTVANGSEEASRTIQITIWPLFYARDSSEEEEVVIERAKVFCADFAK